MCQRLKPCVLIVQKTEESSWRSCSGRAVRSKWAHPANPSSAPRPRHAWWSATGPCPASGPESCRSTTLMGSRWVGQQRHGGLMGVCTVVKLQLWLATPTPTYPPQTYEIGACVMIVSDVSVGGRFLCSALDTSFSYQHSKVNSMDNELALFLLLRPWSPSLSQSDSVHHIHLSSPALKHVSDNILTVFFFLGGGGGMLCLFIYTSLHQVLCCIVHCQALCAS